jgi:hypothetical protein
MRTPRQPERRDVLMDALRRELRATIVRNPRELAASARGSDTRYGAPRQAANLLRLYDELLDGVRMRSLQDVARKLGVGRREAAAMLALASGPDRTRLNPVARALVLGTVREVDLFAPVRPHAIVIAAPNSPAPGVHASGERVSRDGPTFGVGADGNQRFATAYLSASYGPQDVLGYAAALHGWVRPSSRDDERSARRAGRSLAINHPADYVTAFARQVVPVIDTARPGSPPLPLLIIDGRRDCPATKGITLEARLDALLDDPHWATTVAAIPGERVKMIEASDAAHFGGGGLNTHLLYRTAGTPSQTLSAAQVEAGVEGGDPAMNMLLASEWEWLPALDPHSREDESTSVMVFKGTVIDARTGAQGRLLVFSSFTSAQAYVVIPFGPAGDPYPDLAVPGRHVAAQRDISLTARLHVGPSQWTGHCRRNIYQYSDYFYVAAKECSVREMAFAIGVNVRMSTVAFPVDPDVVPSS